MFLYNPCIQVIHIDADKSAAELGEEKGNGPFSFSWHWTGSSL